MKNNFQKIKNLRADDPDLSDEYFEPSERVWTHVSQNLPAKKKRRLPFWIIPMTLGFLALGYFSFWNLDSSQVQPSFSNLQTLSNSNLSETTNVESQVGISNQTNNNVSSEIQKSSLQSTSLLGDSKIGSKNHDSRDVNITLQEDTPNFRLFESSQDNNLGSSERNTNRHIASEVPLNRGIEDLTMVPNNFKKAIERQTKPNTVPISMSVNGGSFIQITQPFRPSFALARVSFTNGARPDYDQGVHHMVESSKYANSFGAHLGYEFSVSNHLSVRAGATFRKSALFTAYNLWMPYDLNSEEMTQTGLHNTFEQELPSIDGDLITQMATVRGFGKEIAHNEPINFDLHAEIRSAHIAIPISLNYFINPNRTGFFVGLGISPGWLFDRSIHLLAAKSNHNGISEERAQLGIRSVRPLFKFAGQALVGYRHSIGGRWYLDGQLQLTSNQNKLGVTRMVTGMFGVSMML